MIINKIQKFVFNVVLILIIMLFSCVSTSIVQSRVYNSANLGNSREWVVVIDNNENQNVEIQVSGMLIDKKNKIVSDLYYLLKDNGLKIAKERNENTSTIKIIPGFDEDLWVKDISFILLDSKGNDIARIVISCYSRWDEKIAKSYADVFSKWFFENS